MSRVPSSCLLPRNVPARYRTRSFAANVREEERKKNEIFFTPIYKQFGLLDANLIFYYNWQYYGETRFDEQRHADASRCMFIRHVAYPCYDFFF